MQLDHMDDEVILTRNGKEIHARVYVQGNDVFAPFDIDAEEGDLFHFEGFRADQIVAKVERRRGPGGRLAHTQLKLVTIREWAERNAAMQPKSNVTQHIGVAMNVAGRDLQNKLTVNITVAQLLEKIQEAIDESAEIPDAEKSDLKGKIGALLNNPYVSALGSAYLWEYIKPLFGF